MKPNIFRHEGSAVSGALNNPKNSMVEYRWNGATFKEEMDTDGVRISDMHSSQKSMSASLPQSTGHNFQLRSSPPPKPYTSRRLRS